MTRKTTLLRSLAAGALLAMGIGAALAQPAQTPLRVVLDAELQVLDPIATTSYVTRSFAYMVFDTLISMDSRGEYHPQMLEGWQVSDDRMSYTFRLREGLEWHDGSPVTAEDCVASLRRWAARDGFGRHMMAATQELRIVDARTFVLQLARPFGLVIEAIGKPSSNVPVMMPARLASMDPMRAVPEVVGSGPFLFRREEWRPGDRAIFRRNPRYRPRSEPADGLAGGRVVHFDRVDFVSVPDPATKVAALTQGEIDYIQYTPMDFVPRLMRDRNIRVVTDRGMAQFMGAIRLNHTQPPFNNQLAREAFQQLMDQREFLAALGVPRDMYLQNCTSMFMCDAPYSSTAGTERLRDPSIERARELLRRSGYNNEPAVVLQSTDVPLINTISLVTIDRMRQAGFNVVVRATDWSTVAQQRWSREPPDRGGWSALPLIWVGYDLANPLTHYGVGYNCTDGYPGWSCDERTTELLNRFVAEPDAARRREIAGELQARAHEIVSVGLAGQFTNPASYRSDLQDMINIGIPVFWNVRRVAR